ncbi:hypothetical protein PLESTB_001216000 [Pleodorina starrii]|uniref:Mitochondrial import inner membrane translocase subunit TIM22 n=1 Tax=Pleodorina starrii TaxID=330485 RepID=A0A9W6F695_9CHLO|nr:hypothetical protein PLESTM_001643400 [Pleodorina starrii]GLC57360.1 hypothetical protein PLESTB_001216000 [Pleodorina starrii]GLC71243.1 hypothetical protein PLESTF_001094200 [Pleodorina starrii]
MSSSDADRVASSASASTSGSGEQPPAAPAAAPPKKKKEWSPIAMPTHEQLAAQEFMDNCFVKSAMSGAMGGLAGFAFGLFTASMENAHGGLDTVPEITPEKTTRVILREMFQNMKSKSVSYAKGFALMGALYSFNECVIEKWRAKHDKVNPALAGCATGAIMAHSAGPTAMCWGCASFAAFSTAIEYWMDT